MAAGEVTQLVRRLPRRTPRARAARTDTVPHLASDRLWSAIRAGTAWELVAGLSRVVEPHLDDMLAFGAYGEGPSLTLPPDASQQTRLLDWFGRRP